MLVFKPHHYFPKVADLKRTRFVPAHVFSAKELFGTNKEIAEHRPDSIDTGYDVFRFSHGVCQAVRTVQADDQAEIERLEAELAELERLRRDAIGRAYIRGAPVKLAEARSWQKE